MRTKPAAVFLSFLLSVVLVACGGGQVAVRVVDETPDGDVQPQEDIVVQFLPYDRDSVFEALEARADSPEPPIPDTLRALYAEIIERQEEWRQAESEWQRVRDRLKTLSDRMRGMDETSAEYRQLYQEFTDLEPRVNRLDRQKQQAFEEFNQLQNRVIAFADSIEQLRSAWGDRAYRDYNTIVDSILDARGREVRSDTTGADGWASVSLPGGDWWAYARVQRPFEELYWNVLVRPAETDSLVLSPDNAEIRLRL